MVLSARIDVLVRACRSTRSWRGRPPDAERRWRRSPLDLAEGGQADALDLTGDQAGGVVALAHLLEGDVLALGRHERVEQAGVVGVADPRPRRRRCRRATRSGGGPGRRRPRAGPTSRGARRARRRSRPGRRAGRRASPGELHLEVGAAPPRRPIRLAVCAGLAGGLALAMPPAVAMLLAGGAGRLRHRIGAAPRLVPAIAAAIAFSASPSRHPSPRYSCAMPSSIRQLRHYAVDRRLFGLLDRPAGDRACRRDLYCSTFERMETRHRQASSGESNLLRRSASRPRVWRDGDGPFAARISPRLGLPPPPPPPPPPPASARSTRSTRLAFRPARARPASKLSFLA